LALKNRLLAALACVILALALSVSLLRYANDHSITHADGTFERTMASDPIVTTYSEVLDFACFDGAPCSDVVAAANVQGLYPRQGVPVAVAVLAGLTLPLLLVVAAIAFAALRGWVIRLCLGAGALVLLLCLTRFGSDYIQIHADGRLERMNKGAPIYETTLMSGTDDCLDKHPCRGGTYSFTQGVYAAAGIPVGLAIAGGMVMPVLLLGAALALSLRGRLSNRQ
jgi:hypothetical protein